MTNRTAIRINPCLTVLIGIATMPASAMASCAQWDASGAWSLTQSNGQGVRVSLQQDGSTITGSAQWPQITKNSPVLGIGQRGDDIVLHDGSVDGVINGNRFEVQIYWSRGRGAIGVYTGEIGPQGRIEGRTYNRQNPSEQATWFSNATMRCDVQASAKPSTDTPPKVYRKIGKRTPEKQPPVDSVTDASRTFTAVVGAADICKSGYVWREAGPDDRVCVPPESRTRVAAENRVAFQRRDPEGAYGADSCMSGYVWREAFNGDVVCVTPDVRQLVREENRVGASRRERD